MKRLLTGVLVALAIAACGEKQEGVNPSAGRPQTLTVMLDWYPNADHVGMYRALAEGDFARAALDVHVQVPGNPALPLQLLAAGKLDVAISYEPEVLLARNQGLPLVSVAAMVQEPLTSIVSLGSARIRSPADLRGKKVGDAGLPYQHAYLETILARAHVPPSSVTEINVGANLLTAMLSRRVAATLGAYWNYEAIQLALLRKHPHVIRMNQVGVPTYDELVVVVRKSTLVAHPGEIRRFVQALARGYESARQSPQAAVANLVSANSGLDPKLQLASVQATLPAFFPSTPGKPWGWQDPAQWAAYGEWMLREHLISNPRAVIDASTNELLAGQGI
ncbi:MAG: ABC transporter substrate-binding protein [Actinomycetota bacterium]|nr:ABC transporter substrate-binding protein [Actinomycetota bacterium]